MGQWAGRRQADRGQTWTGPRPLPGPRLSPASHGSFFSRLLPKSRATQATTTEKVKSRDQPARAELRSACWVTVVQQLQAQPAAALARQDPIPVKANIWDGSVLKRGTVTGGRDQGFTVRAETFR